MDSEHKVSVIVPIYNAEKYLLECVTSVINETYFNLEIILIDDGSTDDSLMICKTLAERDTRIKVYHHENRGVSFSRNFGIDVSTGQFITFLDADDKLSPNFIEVYLNDFDEQIGIVFGGYQIYQDNILIGSSKERKSQVITITDKYDFDKEDNRKRECWGAIYKKEILNGVRFKDDLYVGEDTLFLGQAIKKCKVVYFESKSLYEYRILNESAYHGKMNKKKITELEAWGQICLLFHDWENSYNSCKKEFFNKMCVFYLNDDIRKNKEIRNQVKNIEKKYNMLLKNLSIKNRIKFFIVKNCGCFYLMLKRIK